MSTFVNYNQFTTYIYICKHKQIKTATNSR